MTIDNTIKVNRDYAAVREQFLSQIEDEKIKGTIAELGVLRLNLQQVFPKTSGWGAKAAVKKKMQIVRAVKPVLDTLLFEGEEVRFVTRGVFSSIIESYFLGWLSAHINRTVFVFTNYRVILMNADSKARPLQMKWHIPYDQIKKFKANGLLGMTFKLVNKKSYSFSGLPRQDRKPLQAMVKGMIEQTHIEDFHIPCHDSRDHLCSTCTMPVPPKTFTCPRCSEEFISPMKPALMSLFIPCLGDLYLGHRLIAGMEIMGYMASWLIIGIIVYEDGLMAALPIIGIILLFGHVFDSLLTAHMARKGLVAERLAWRRHQPYNAARIPASK